MSGLPGDVAGVCVGGGDCHLDPWGGLAGDHVTHMTKCRKQAQGRDPQEPESLSHAF